TLLRHRSRPYRQDRGLAPLRELLGRGLVRHVRGARATAVTPRQGREVAAAISHPGATVGQGPAARRDPAVERFLLRGHRRARGRTRLDRSVGLRTRLQRAVRNGGALRGSTRLRPGVSWPGCSLQLAFDAVV